MAENSATGSILTAFDTLPCTLIPPKIEVLTMKDHVCDEKVVLQRALDVAGAVKWSGDMTVNLWTACKAARVLATEVRRLQKDNEDQSDKIKRLEAEIVGADEELRDMRRELS